MPVYLIRSGDAGPVKIGWATNVAARRKELQIAQPYPLYVLRTIDGAKNLERWFHQHYQAERLLGEWFAFREDMLTIEPPDLRPPRPPKTKKKPLSPEIQRWQDEMCKPGLGDPCDDCRRKDGLPLRPYRLMAE